MPLVRYVGGQRGLEAEGRIQESLDAAFSNLTQTSSIWDAQSMVRAEHVTPKVLSDFTGRLEEKKSSPDFNWQAGLMLSAITRALWDKGERDVSLDLSRIHSSGEMPLTLPPDIKVTINAGGGDIRLITPDSKFIMQVGEGPRETVQHPPNKKYVLRPNAGDRLKITVPTTQKPGTD